MNVLPRLGFIGMGKVGSTLARAWHQVGYPISAIYSRHADKTHAIAHDLALTVMNSPLEVVAQADLVFLTVPDDAITTLATELALASWEAKAAVHTSGAADRSHLAILAERGAMIGSLHPALPFADEITTLQRLKGATFALESTDAQLQNWLSDLVHALKAEMMLIPTGKKAQYHAALVIASNYTVTLYAIAERLLDDLGADPSAIQQALMALLEGTVANLKQRGIPDALTGPLVRGDVGTIASHLRALQPDPALHDLYCQLARATYPLLKARGVNLTLIEALLTQDERHDPFNDS